MACNTAGIPSPSDARSTLAVYQADGRQEIDWNDALEELLCDEAEKCSGLAWLHNKSELHYANRHNWLAIPSIVISTITGATQFGTPALFPGNEHIAGTTLGGVSIFVSVLGLLMSHFGFGKRAEGHRIGRVQYAQIHRTVAIEMSLPRSQRTPPKQLLRLIKDDLKRLMETIPRVPESIIRRYRSEIVPHTPNVSHPEITNGVHPVEPYLSPQEPKSNTSAYATPDSINAVKVSALSSGSLISDTV